jgi:hypothetical protein
VWASEREWRWEEGRREGREGKEGKEGKERGEGREERELWAWG